MIRVTAAHAEALATIHAAAFPAAERWDARAMVDVLGMPGTFGVIDPRGGLLLARAAGGEAEILTLGVVPASRRLGVGRALLDDALATIGDIPVFLEVAADNVAALALYHAAGLRPCARRRGYYGPGRDALVLRCHNRS